MLSTIVIGSKQYLVQLGTILKVEKLKVEKGDTWLGKEVLLFQNGEGELNFGQPAIEKAQVKALVIRHGKHKKILIVKKKRRKGYRRTQGHRQQFTEIQIISLADEKGVWHNYKPIKKEAVKKTKQDSKTPETKQASKTSSKKEETNKTTKKE